MYGNILFLWTKSGRKICIGPYYTIVDVGINEFLSGYINMVPADSGKPRTDSCFKRHGVAQKSDRIWIQINDQGADNIISYIESFVFIRSTI